MTKNTYFCNSFGLQCNIVITIGENAKNVYSISNNIFYYKHCDT